MDQGLKERLVGAAVLIAIAVWLIPWVLDGPEASLGTGAGSLQLPVAEEPMPMRTQTLRLGGASDAVTAPVMTAASPVDPEPTPPAETPQEAALAPASVQPEPPPAPAPAESEPPAVAVAAAAPAPPPKRPSTGSSPPPAPRAAAALPADAAAAIGDWTVQLGSFSEEANARRLAQRSGTFGYKADVSSYTNGARTLYRVRVGPAQSRAEADATASALKAHGVDARVVAAR